MCLSSFLRRVAAPLWRSEKFNSDFTPFGTNHGDRADRPEIVGLKWPEVALSRLKRGGAAI